MRFRHPWPLFEAVRRFRITIETYDEAGLQVSHVGSGHLRVDPQTSSSGSTLHWHEEGAWLTGALAGIRFRNRTTWRREVGAPKLHLSHLRRGVQAPTFLATLVPGPRGTWIAEAPHTCGPDLYIPSLECRGSHLNLRWDVRSPVDPYVLHFEAWSETA
jgi:Family of unknown function (DUF6314)